MLALSASSIEHWTITLIVLTACSYSWYAAKHIHTCSIRNRMIELNLWHLLIINLVTAVIREEGEAIYYVGIPAIFLSICVFALFIMRRRDAALTN